MSNEVQKNMKICFCPPSGGQTKDFNFSQLLQDDGDAPVMDSDDGHADSKQGREWTPFADERAGGEERIVDRSGTELDLS